jgi:thioredoxin-related protein
VDEGGYKISQNYIYNHSNNMVQADGKSFKVAAHMQDMLSAFYYARTIDFSAAKKNDIYTIPAFVDNEVFNLKIKFVGREIINTDHGNIYCMKFRPILQKGRIFKHEEDLNVWISDDDNHIPIRAQAEILVGSIKMDLHQFSGTKSKLRFN